MINKSLVFILSFAVFACVNEAPFKNGYKGFEPIENQDGWRLSNMQEVEMDSSLLEKAYKLIYQDDRFVMARSLLVIRNGKLVAEAYPNDPKDINRAYNIQSCTKSITSLLVGSAMAEGKIEDLEEPLYNIYPEYFEGQMDKRDISLKDALLMQTGLEFDNNIHTQHQKETKGNSIEFVLGQDKIYTPGTITKYNDGAPHLVSKAIEKKCGKSLKEYAETRLFSPLGIDDWKWESSNDGTTFGAFSLFLSARDLAKVGQLLLQNGHWKGEEIVDSLYLNEATSILTSANFNSEPYGYYFWILPAFKGYCALGHGGQFLLVVPDKELVVVYTAFPYSSEQFWGERNELMDIIVKSCL